MVSDNNDHRQNLSSIAIIIMQHVRRMDEVAIIEVVLDNLMDDIDDFKDDDSIFANAIYSSLSIIARFV